MQGEKADTNVVISYQLEKFISEGLALDMADCLSRNLLPKGVFRSLFLVELERMHESSQVILLFKNYGVVLGQQVVESELKALGEAAFDWVKFH